MNRILAMTAALACTTLAANAQNLLVNSSFEDGPMGFFDFDNWEDYGNVFPADSGETAPLDGLQMAKSFGSSNGIQSDQVMIQVVPGIMEGELYTLSAQVKNLSTDALGEENRVFVQIVFQDSGGADLELINSSFLDVDPGTGVFDAWTELSVSAIAPAGTTQLKAVLLHVQLGTDAGFPNQGGGAAFWDSVSLTGGDAPCINAADLNGDGQLDFIDISLFVDAFTAGCPDDK